MKRLLTIVLACAAMAGCGSPEAVRARGGGAGGDTGNRDAVVKMHEGSRQYWETPVEISGQHPPLGPSEQARQLSMPRTRQDATERSQSDRGRDQ